MVREQEGWEGGVGVGTSGGFFSGQESPSASDSSAAGLAGEMDQRLRAGPSLPRTRTAAGPGGRGRAGQARP